MPSTHSSQRNCARTKRFEIDQLHSFPSSPKPEIHEILSTNSASYNPNSSKTKTSATSATLWEPTQIQQQQQQQQTSITKRRREMSKSKVIPSCPSPPPILLQTGRSSPRSTTSAPQRAQSSPCHLCCASRRPSQFLAHRPHRRA